MSSKCSEDKKPRADKQPVVLVVGIDNSATMNGFPIWSTKQMEAICNAMNLRCTDVYICIGTIGNPSDEGFKRLRLTKIPNIDNNATMGVRAKQRKAAEQITEQNTVQINLFLNNVSLERKHEKKTCLNKFCTDAATLLNEPQFDSYLKLLVLYTDGFEDSNGDNRVDPICANFSDDVSVFTIGWKNQEKINHSGLHKEFADIDGVISYLSTL